jgi:cell division protein FtsW
MISATISPPRIAPRRGGIRLDWVIVGLVSTILLLGLVMVTSASITMAARDNAAPFLYLERQLALVLFGLLAAALIFCVPTARLERLALPLLLLAGVLSLAVLVPGLGHVVNGSRRWLRLGPVNFQVSELVRVLVLIYIAHYCVRFETALRSDLQGVLRPLLLLGAAAVLLLLEPDLGAGAVLFLTGFGLLYLGGAQIRWVALTLLGGAGTLAALVLLSPYRMRRIMAFLDPWADPYNGGFQLVQSLIAIGRGQWFGVGLGASVQKLFYLPEAHNDFLFAVLAEELGLVGVVATLGLFLALVWRVFALAQRAHSAGLKFQAYLAAGFGLWLGLQAFVNIGVNLGVLPTKGLTLPLMSYGRSSLIVTLAWLGIILRVHHDTVTSARGPLVRERAP